RVRRLDERAPDRDLGVAELGIGHEAQVGGVVDPDVLEDGAERPRHDDAALRTGDGDAVDLAAVEGVAEIERPGSRRGAVDLDLARTRAREPNLLALEADAFGIDARGDGDDRAARRRIDRRLDRRPGRRLRPVARPARVRLVHELSRRLDGDRAPTARCAW